MEFLEGYQEATYRKDRLIQQIRRFSLAGLGQLFHYLAVVLVIISDLIQLIRLLLQMLLAFLVLHKMVY